MIFDWKKLKQKICSTNYRALFFSCLYKSSRWIIFASLLIMAASCFNLWYKYVYHSEWKEGEKKAYINTKERGVIFNSKRFDDVIFQQEERKAEFEKEDNKPEDIFRLGERSVK